MGQSVLGALGQGRCWWAGLLKALGWEWGGGLRLDLLGEDRLGSRDIAPTRGGHGQVVWVFWAVTGHSPRDS